jgi:hypothetical protein
VHSKSKLQQPAIVVLAHCPRGPHTGWLQGLAVAQSAATAQQPWIGGFWHWCWASQRSKVQLFPSLQSAPVRQQLATAEWVQVPPEQLSAVQALPSSQSAGPLQQPGVRSCAQAPPMQLSAVQVLPSLQSAGTVQQPAAGCEQVPPGPEH